MKGAYGFVGRYPGSSAGVSALRLSCFAGSWKETFFDTPEGLTPLTLRIDVGCLEVA